MISGEFEKKFIASLLNIKFTNSNNPNPSKMPIRNVMDKYKKVKKNIFALDNFNKFIRLRIEVK